jgi:hypothetical protein
MKSKHQRRQDADARNHNRKNISNEKKLAQLDYCGYAAVRERARLTKE